MIHIDATFADTHIIADYDHDSGMYNATIYNTLENTKSGNLQLQHWELNAIMHNLICPYGSYPLGWTDEWINRLKASIDPEGTLGRVLA